MVEGKTTMETMTIEDSRAIGVAEVGSQTDLAINKSSLQTVPEAAPSRREIARALPARCSIILACSQTRIWILMWK